MPQLRSYLVRHHQDRQLAANALQAADRVGASLDHLQANLRRLSRLLDRTRAAPKPIELRLAQAIHQLGGATVDTALFLPPAEAQLPVRAAFYALNRALDLAVDLGLGR